METLQLKQNLHELIEQTANSHLLEAVYTILSQTSPDVQAEKGFALNPTQNMILEQAIAECEADPDGGESWETVRTRILSSRK